MGTGATTTGVTKTVNLGTGGASGSTTVVNIGSATAGAGGTTVVNTPIVTFANAVTQVGMPQANLTAQLLGLGGASADSYNRLSVNTPAVLLNNAGAGIEAALARRVVELISLTRKSGNAVAGFEKVKEWLAGGRAKVLFQASDGSDRGKGKLWTPTGGRWFGCLTASELGLAFGRDHVIHSALAPGGLTEKVIRDAARLNGLRGHIGSSAAGKDSRADER